MKVNKLALALLLSCLAYEVNAKEAPAAPAKITAEQSEEAALTEALESMTDEESEAFLKEAEALTKKLERITEAHNVCMSGKGLKFQETKPAGWKLKVGGDSCTGSCETRKVERANEECREQNKHLRGGL